jgi:hypothetical protein
MSKTKYSAKATTLLGDDVALSDHAAARYRERTPHDCEVPVTLAFRRGEWIQHPQVAQADGHDEPPDRVRVYWHGQAWGVVFLVIADDQPGGQPWTCATIMDVGGFEHGPSRAYLHSYGPHHDEVVGDA